MKANKSALCASALLAIAMLVLVPARSSRAATVEGFETLTLTGTNSIGDASIRTPNYFGINPTEGTHELLLTTINNTSDAPATNQSGTNAVANVATAGGLANFFGLAASNIRDGIVTGTEGSGFKLSLGFLPIGAVITFNYDFLTNEVQPGAHNDFAFATLGSGNVLVVADTFGTLTPTTGLGNPFALETGYKTFTINITTAATYTLGIGVVDGTTTDTSSALLIDNIAVIVPEPSTVGLGMAGAVLLIALRRVIKKTS